jgi:hypothetical protein
MTDARFRFGAAALLLGVVLLLGWWFLAASPAAAMHAYLAAWLVAAALPLGALPWVMAIDLVGTPLWTAGVVVPLRRMLWLLPVAGLLLIPILAAHGAVFPASRLPSAFGRSWMAPTPSIVRSVVYFIIWCGLGLIFATPPRAGSHGRRGLAVIGLAVHLPLITLAAIDWAMATEAGWSSPIFGLLFLSSQMLLALAAAILLAGAEWRLQAGAPMVVLLLTGCAVWLFLQFIQFLVIWSADLPNQVTWYIHRDADAGITVEWIGFLGGFMIPAAALGAMGWYRRPGVIAGIAALLLVVQALEMLWLVTPSYRHHFGLGGTEVAGSIGLVAVLLACAMLGNAIRNRHGAANA